MKGFFKEEELQGEFKNVPIEHSKNNEVEIYNMYTTPYSPRDRLRKKICKYAFIVFLIFAFIIFTKKVLLEGIVHMFYDEEEDEFYNKNYFNSKNYNFTLDEDGFEYNEGEIFYFHQNESNINIDSLSSPQLKNPKNIKLINNLEVTLGLEYEKFVHLKIRDAEKKRWEIPKMEILNKEYLYSLNDNKVPLSIYSNYLESKLFFIEFITNKFDEEELENYERDHSSSEKDFENIEEFSFRISNIKEEQFYSFNSSQNFIFSENYINFQSELTSDKIYGFGERSHDFKLNEGLYTIWPNEPAGIKYDKGLGGGNAYGHFPIALHKTKCDSLWVGFVFLNTNAQDVKIIKKNETNINLEHKTIGGVIDYYIIIDESPEEVLKDIQFLLGIPTLPPFWSLGNHQCRYGYKDFEEFKKVYEEYKKCQIPIDTMWIDIDAMDNYEIFTLNNKFKQLGPYVNDEIHKDGGKFVPIVDLGLSCDNKNSSLVQLGNSLDIFIKSNYTKKPLISRVWPEKTLFPDFMNPKTSEFWNKGLTSLQNLVNFDGIWLDMNEPATILKNEKCLTEIADEKDCTKDKNMYNIDNLSYLPGYNGKENEYILAKRSISENALVNENLTVYDTRPLISYFEGKSTYDYLFNNLKIRPFILSRSTTIGSGKYVFHWLGDNYSEESNIKDSISGIFNFNIFGIPFTGADICGFNNNATKDLCIRWYNLGAFYPFMRNHKDRRGKDQYPWSFNDINNMNNNKTNDKKDNNNNYDAVNLIKNNINYRYSLLRYMYSQLFLISLNEKGSFFKPVMFEFPEDENSYEDIESKVMIGEAFLLCAFYEVNEKDKEFILPNETFNKYPLGKTIIDKNDKEKNNKIMLSGKLDEIHLFLREGFIVPRQNTFDKYILNTKKLREEKLDLIINVDKDKKSRGVIFYDNDDINTINENKYYRVEMDYDGNKLTISTFKNNLINYNYNDHILGSIELWNVGFVYNEITKDNKCEIEIDLISGKKYIDGQYDSDNDKIIFNIQEKEKDISLFDIKTIIFNFK